MKTLFARMLVLTKQTFMTTPNTLVQYLIILVVSLSFIWMPQKPPVDWDLNTDGFWANIPQTYSLNQGFVYPPWGLILLLPYYFFRAAGARVLSVITIGWLTYTRKWPLSLFFAIVLSPYFFRTMVKSNLDILVIVFPIILWECSKGKKWESLARGISLAIMFLKPQCTFLMIIFLLWKNRKEWNKLLLQLGIVSLIIVPISLYGSPPLIIQWLNNVLHPSAQNHFFWSVNNISLAAKYGYLTTSAILFLAILVLFLLYKAGIISWSTDQTTSTIYLSAMFLSPYTSQQSFSSGISFVPSWPGFFIQWLSIGLGVLLFWNYDNVPLFSFAVASLSLLLFSLKPGNKMKAHSI